MTTHPSAHDVLEKARRGGYAVGAFNVSNLTFIKAVVQAAKKLRSPVIIETSPHETAEIGADVQAAILDIYEQHAGVPILINLDHATTYAQVKVGMDAGYEMLHFDGSLKPVSTNVRILQRVVREAHRRRLSVEGELDHVTGSSVVHDARVESEQAKQTYTDPGEAAAFVKKTGIDIFASFFGNVHGVYRNPPTLDFDRLRAIRAAVPCFLSMHGGSGTRSRDFKRAVHCGVSKINISTELRIAYINTLRAMLKKNRGVVAPYALTPPIVAAVQKVVEEKIKLFGSAGKA